MRDSTSGSNVINFLMVVCAVAFTVLSSVDVSDARPGVFPQLKANYGDQMLRFRRGPGFRQGAIDRVGHQFGKRSELDELLSPPDLPAEYVMTDEYVADAISNNPKLSLMFVRRYVDTDNDGFVTSSELQQLLSDD